MCQYQTQIHCISVTHTLKNHSALCAPHGHSRTRQKDYTNCTKERLYTINSFCVLLRSQKENLQSVDQRLSLVNLNFNYYSYGSIFWNRKFSLSKYSCIISKLSIFFSFKFSLNFSLLTFNIPTINFKSHYLSVINQEMSFFRQTPVKFQYAFHSKISVPFHHRYNSYTTYFPPVLPIAQLKFN